MSVNYPKGEDICVRYHNRAGELIFLLTNKLGSEYYFLYEYRDNVFNRIGKSKSPAEIEERFNIQEIMNK